MIETDIIMPMSFYETNLFIRYTNHEDAVNVAVAMYSTFRGIEIPSNIAHVLH